MRLRARIGFGGLRIRQVAIARPFPEIAAEIVDIAGGPVGFSVRMRFDRARSAAVTADIASGIDFRRSARGKVRGFVVASWLRRVAPRVATPVAVTGGPLELRFGR